MPTGKKHGRKRTAYSDATVKTTDPNALIRLPVVMALTGLGRQSIYNYVNEKRFPRPVKVGERASAWVYGEVIAWNKERMESRAA